MTMAEDLSCQELVELVTDYLDGALPQADHDRFEAHLEVCGACRRYLDQIQRTIELAGSLTPESLDPQAERELVAAFRGWNSR